MLDRLQKLLRAFGGGSAKPKFVFDEGDHRVAAAGLLVHAMNVDGVQSPLDELAMLWVLNLSDGMRSLLDIAECSECAFREIRHAASLLLAHGLLSRSDA